MKVESVRKIDISISVRMEKGGKIRRRQLANRLCFSKSCI